MNKHHTWILSFIITVAGAAAQVAGPRGVAPALTPADLVKAGVPKVIERGPNHRKWAHVTPSTGPDGLTVLKTNRYTEIGTGLHYQRNGEWLEAREVIELVPGGALASEGAHQVGFAANLNTPGAINLLLPNGQRLRSHILGLAYTDAATGASVLLAGINDSVGQLVGDNQIIYQDAFKFPDGTQADVRYTYTRSGLEQDVILRHAPPRPEAYGLNPATTRLEVYTEFTEAPEPVKLSNRLSTADPARRAALTMPDLVDEHLDFGPMQFVAGRAFPLGEEDNPEAVPTAKSWEKIQGRTFLIEAVQYPAIQDSLKTLEAKAGPKRADALPKARPGRTFPNAPRRAGKATESIRRTAALSGPPSGFVIDYSAVISGVTNFTFAADQTYYVSLGIFNLWGTTVLEGGTVIKFTNTASYNSGTMLKFRQGVDCQTSPYRPAVFTSMHDNTVGDPILNSTGNPTNFCSYAMLYLGFAPGTYFDFHDVRIRHANRAIYGVATTQVDFRNSQISRCRTAFINQTASWNIRNVLITGVDTAFDGTGPHTNRAEHLTLHSVSNFLSSGLPAVNLTNSLLIGVTNNVLWTGTGVETNLSGAGIFQTVGAGAHYLADPSPYRDAGTTNIQAALRADLRQRTTYPPLVIAPAGYYYGVSQTWFPRAARDTDLPDLGYHYDPLDYAISAIYLTNATITVEPGTAIGVFNVTNTAYYGLALSDGARLLAEGRADARVTFTDYATCRRWRTPVGPGRFTRSWIRGTVLLARPSCAPASPTSPRSAAPRPTCMATTPDRPGT